MFSNFHIIKIYIQLVSDCSTSEEHAAGQAAASEQGAVAATQPPKMDTVHEEAAGLNESANTTLPSDITVDSIRDYTSTAECVFVDFGMTQAGFYFGGDAQAF